mmetsp:Transcript_30089/g.77619  ORF Transcript_30089/g.77619 Transcript_30089/m.77619 type:complete len:809 (-) Transcript_30089:1173-3599(-)|eukprot:CAMPEP_0113887682 /NCGR_PEP_ID=MMETSP0780_2-20120614/12364_1 /TAXON_ID=652834 /ORGANISM="Palpitomonas bilix" /LENGTH=808 /DNA_ID=CAMNT_0000876271 /DNA_START=120 /DNA_END=2546 /DNA_ORIENTATION=- /assembly_acc=CAM_ASM_000599
MGMKDKLLHTSSYTRRARVEFFERSWGVLITSLLMLIGGSLLAIRSDLVSVQFSESGDVELPTFFVHDGYYVVSGGPPQPQSGSCMAYDGESVSFDQTVMMRAWNGTPVCTTLLTILPATAHLVRVIYILLAMYLLSSFLTLVCYFAALALLPSPSSAMRLCYTVRVLTIVTLLMSVTVFISFTFVTVASKWDNERATDNTSAKIGGEVGRTTTSIQPPSIQVGANAMLAAVLALYLSFHTYCFLRLPIVIRECAASLAYAMSVSPLSEREGMRGGSGKKGEKREALLDSDEMEGGEGESETGGVSTAQIELAYSNARWGGGEGHRKNAEKTGEAKVSKMEWKRGIIALTESLGGVVFKVSHPSPSTSSSSPSPPPLTTTPPKPPPSRLSLVFIHRRLWMMRGNVIGLIEAGFGLANIIQGAILMAEMREEGGGWGGTTEEVAASLQLAVGFVLIGIALYFLLVVNFSKLLYTPSRHFPFLSPPISGPLPPSLPAHSSLSSPSSSSPFTAVREREEEKRGMLRMLCTALSKSECNSAEATLVGSILVPLLVLARNFTYRDSVPFLLCLTVLKHAVSTLYAYARATDCHRLFCIIGASSSSASALSPPLLTDTQREGRREGGIGIVATTTLDAIPPNRGRESVGNGVSVGVEDVGETIEQNDRDTKMGMMRGDSGNVGEQAATVEAISPFPPPLPHFSPLVSSPLFVCHPLSQAYVYLYVFRQMSIGPLRFARFASHHPEDGAAMLQGKEEVRGEGRGQNKGAQATSPFPLCNRVLKKSARHPLNALFFFALLISHGATFFCFLLFFLL